MRIGGQEIDEKIITRVQQTIDAHPGVSRVGLSRRICEDLGWRSRNGRLKEVSCRVALLKLHRRGALRLPAAGTFGGRRSGAAPSAPVAQAAPVCGALQEVQPVEVVVVGGAATAPARVWTALMDRYHYLGAGPLCGAQLRYLIRSPTAGWLGGLAFSAAAWRVAARDRWIGWGPSARLQNLDRVVGNSRFLILPQVRVPHLASHVLGLVARRLAHDWRQRYGYEPLLVETYIEAGRFSGTCYRAANWVEVGQTHGRGRQDRAHRRAAPVKRVFVYPLVAQARQQLCEGAPVRARSPAPPTPHDWAETEFGRARLPDRRLRRRLLVLARDFYARPQAQIPQACRSRARTKAAYRFLHHPHTHMDVLLEPHVQATVERLAAHKVVLAVQDTTSLNYSTHPATVHLGPIGSRPEGILGLLLHDTMAFSVDGTPLGLLDVHGWARDGRAFGKKHQRRQRPIEDKESQKWLRSFRAVAAAQRQCPHTRLVSVGDREADLYELFHLAVADPTGPQLLVRAEQNRVLADGHGHLWAAVASQPRAGIQEIQVPRNAAAPARVARLDVRFATVVLQPPQRKRQYGPVRLWAVLAEEADPPDGVEPLRWLLLTTCPVTSFAEATEKLAWYTQRWGIEIFHKTLKSGCKIEERQLGDAATIEACLAIDLVVAWRVYHLTKLGREVPDVPCTVFFEEAEWKALATFLSKTPVLEGPPPTLREATRMVASLGGFLGRKGDGDPGTKSLWLGLQRLDDITVAYQIFVPHIRPPPVSSVPRYG